VAARAAPGGAARGRRPAAGVADAPVLQPAERDRRVLQGEEVVAVGAIDCEGEAVDRVDDGMRTGRRIAYAAVLHVHLHPSCMLIDTVTRWHVES
jgi:hypothetical protein